MLATTSYVVENRLADPEAEHLMSSDKLATYQS